MSKQFPGSLALRDIDLAVFPGRVMAVVGANGSGKTTLLSVLCGLLPPTRGTVAIDGVEAKLTSPRQAIDHGVVYVPQEPQLAPTLPAWENVLLSSLGRLARRRPGEAARQRARAIASEALEGRSPDTLVARLRKAERAMLSLAAALGHQPRVLALDEPTAVLGDRGVEIVERAAREVVARGGAVLLVSHRLRDIVRLATDVTVLVDGVCAHRGPIETSTIEVLIDRLTPGRDERAAASRRPSPGLNPSVTRLTSPAPVPGGSDVVLRARGLRTESGLDVENLEVGAGEIVGVAGLSGSGRSRLCRLVAGCERYSGAIDFSGGPHVAHSSTMRRRGLGYVPEDRKREGIFPPLSVERNLEVADLALSPGLARPWPFRPARERWRGVADGFGVKRAAETTRITTLSGGNQQRVLLARTLVNRPRLLVADEPTQGVDRSGRAAIHDMLREYTAGGGAALVVSSEFEELLELAGRIVVMLDGSLVASLGSTVSYRDLMSAATIGTSASGSPQGEPA